MLIQLDDEYEVHYTAIDIQEVMDLTEETYQPRGMTALLDAIGRTIVSTKKRLECQSSRVNRCERAARKANQRRDGEGKNELN